MSERSLRIVFIVLAAFHVALGLYMLVDPGGFFDRIGQYAIRNDHYVGDLGAVYLGLGVALALAVSRPAWRAPLLVFAALWYGAHAVNHLFDIDEAESDARGISDTILLAIGAVLFAWLARIAERIRASDGATAERRA
jgi:hypothetical protein